VHGGGEQPVAVALGVGAEPAGRVRGHVTSLIVAKWSFLRLAWEGKWR
jgi:hypothetical protein